MSRKPNAIEQNPWLGPMHILKDRMRAFVEGTVELDETEHAHIIVCNRCSHKIADAILAHIEKGGDHPGLRKIWDMIFPNRDDA